MADVTIDKVQIEIEASAGSADKVLKNLEKSLGNVKRAMGGFDTSSLDKVNNRLGKMSSALDSISKKQGSNKINISPTVNTSDLGKVEKQIEKSLDGIRDKFTRMGALANSAIGGDSSSITSYQRQAISLQGDIDVLLSKFERFKDVKVQSDDFLKLDNQIEDLHVKLENLIAKEREAMNGVPMDNDAYIKLQTNIVNTKSQIDALITKQQEMVSDGSYMVNPFEQYMTALDVLRNKFYSTSQDVQAAKDKMQSGDVEPNTEPAKSKLQALGSAAKDTANKILSLGGNGLKSALSGLKTAFDKIKHSAESVKKGVEKLHGHFDKGFMKVLKYGFGIRSLYVLFRRLRKVVTNAFEGLQSSGAFFTTTRANVEGLKISLSTLGAQFGAAFEPIFNAVAPALQTFINYLIQAMNVFSAFTAKLMGKDAYSRAVASSGAVAKNVGGAAKSAKELNKQLQGFDELNNLSSNDSSGGGGGSGSSSDANKVEFVAENVDSTLGDFGKNLAELIKNGEWESVGSAIGEKLAEQLNSIKWENLKSKAATFGTNFANFFNGLISPDSFGAVGTAAGEAINTALTGSLAFAQKFNWENLGTSVATGINNFVKVNPLSLVVDNFNAWANGILDAVIEAVEGVGWKDLGQNIADAIGKIDSWSIGWKLGTLVSSLCEALYDLVSVKETWTNIGQKVADGINGFFEGFDGKGLADTANAIKDGLWKAVTTAVGAVEWTEIGKDIADFLDNLDIGTITIVAAVAFAPAALNAIKSGITSILAKEVAAMGGVSVGTIAVSAILSLAIGWKIGNKLYEAMTGNEVDSGMREQIADIFNGLFSKDKIEFKLGEFIEFTFGESNPWNDFWGDIGEKVYDGVDDVKTKVQTVGGEIITKLKEGISGAINGIGEWLTTNVVEPFKNGVNFAQDIVTKGTQIITDMKTGITNGMQKIGEWVSANIVEPIKTSVKAKWDSVFATIKNVTFSIGAKTEETFNNVKNTVKGWGEKAVEITAKLKGKAADKVNDLKDKLKKLKSKYGKVSLTSSLSDGVTKVVNSINKKISSIKSEISVTANIKGTLEKALKNIKSIYDAIKDKAINITTSFNDSFTSGIKNAWNGIANGLNKAIDVINKIPGVSISHVPTLATGGVATKATNAIFGEAGAEAVVPLENNLGWLKKMSNMMLDGLEDAGKYRQVATPQSLGLETSVGSFNGGINNSGDSELIAEQNRLLAEQNRLLQQIANKDVTISSRDVFIATQKESQNYYNRTGNSPFLM